MFAQFLNSKSGKLGIRSCRFKMDGCENDTNDTVKQAMCGSIVTVVGVSMANGLRPQAPRWDRCLSCPPKKLLGSA